MTPQQHLSGEFDKILNYAIRNDLAAFLDDALPGDPNSHLSHELTNKRKKDPKKSERVESWKSLDLSELLAVIDDRYALLAVDCKAPEAGKCIKRMRDLRNEGAHRTGDIDIHGLYNDTSLLERFAKVIRAQPKTMEVIHDLKAKLRDELERIAGIRTQAATIVEQESPSDFFQPSANPFEQFDSLLDEHEEFVGRSKIIGKIHDFISAHESGTLILEAEPGTGKSALVARCIRHVFADAQPRPAYYFYNCGRGFRDPADCLRTLYDQLVKTHSIEAADRLGLAETPRDLSLALDRLLTQHVVPRLGQNKQLIFIDALDEANTHAELTAYQALPDHLPKGVLVIASTRSIPQRMKVWERREHVQRLNLNSPDFASDHLRDGKNLSDDKAFVTDRLQGQSIDESMQEGICHLADGNWLVLREICRWVSGKLLPEDRTEFLKRLAAEPDGPLRGIYYEFWARISKEHLGAAFRVAGIILETQGPANDALALESGAIGRSDWESGIEHLAEYLRRIDADDGRTYYRVYHQSFADFLRTRVDWEARYARQTLANMCLRWQDLSGEVREYAVQFGPLHLCRAEQWSELETLLTDLEFVEAKCRLGRIRSLIADYQLASEQHPEWRRAFDEEVTRDESLKQWAKDVMLAGRRWRADLDRIWAGSDPDEIELPVPYPFPSPPDTSTLRAQLLQVAQGTPRQLEARVENLQALRAFVTDRAELLSRYPNATLALAFNYSSILAEQAEQKLAQRDTQRDTPWFEELPRPYYIMIRVRSRFQRCQSTPRRSRVVTMARDA